jgi:hypothetical protein
MSWADDLTRGFQAGSMMANTVMQGIRDQKQQERQDQMDALHMALLQQNNPGLHIADKSTVDGQPALKAQAVEPGTENDRVQAFGNGITYNPDEKARVDKEILRNKINAQIEEANALRPTQMAGLEDEMKLRRKYKDDILPSGVRISYDASGNPVASDIPFQGGNTMRGLQDAAQERLRQIDNDKTLSAEDRRFAREKELKNIELINQQQLESQKQTGRETLADRTAELAKGKGKPSESMQNAQMFGARADQAEKELKETLKTFDPATVNVLQHPFDAAGNIVDSVPFLPNRPNATKSADRQSYEQAQKNFVNAVLRKESGASISESEFRNARQQYFPQPGDGAKVLAQKERNRAQAIAGLKAVGSGDPVPDAPNPPSGSGPMKVGRFTITPH